MNTTKHELDVYLEGVRTGLACALHSLAPIVPEQERQATVDRMLATIRENPIATQAVRRWIEANRNAGTEVARS